MRLATGMMITRVAPHVSSASHSLCVRCSSRAMPLPAHASSSSPALCDPVSEVLRCRSSAAATPRRWWRLPARSVSPLGAWALALIPESGARRGDNHRAQCPPGAFGAPRLRRRVPLAEGGFGCRALQGGGPSEAKEGICAELQREDGLAAIAIPTRRVCLEVQYDGRGFSGWERKDGTATVQGALEEAARKVFPEFATFPFHVQGSSRTDAGVHAARNVAHLEMPAKLSIPGARVAAALQRALPASVVVRASAAVDADWDARRVARWRRYRYAIHNARAPDAFLAAYTWHVPQQTLDADRMHLAMQHLRTRSDLRSFARTERHRHVRQAKAEAAARGEASPAGPVKLQQVQDVRSWREGDMVYVEIQADRFLYGQCRMLVGALAAVGLGRVSVEEFQAMCEPSAPTSGRAAAPAAGLCLMEVGLAPELSPFAVEGGSSPSRPPPTVHPFAAL